MYRWLSRRRAVNRVVAATLLFMLAIAVGRARQKQYPYPTVRDQRGPFLPVRGSCRRRRSATVRSRSKPPNRTSV